jgi:hypothetical protein
VYMIWQNKCQQSTKITSAMIFLTLSIAYSVFNILA